MPTEKMWVTYEDGSHLSRSHKTPGDYSPLTRDDGTNELGHVTLRPVAEDDADSPPIVIYLDDDASAAQATESDEFDEAIASLALLAAGLALVTAAPYVKRWWDNTAFPALRSAKDATWRVLARAPSGETGSEGAELSAPIDAAASSRDVESAIGSPGISMTMTEWQERFRLMLQAEAFRDEQWKLLATARVEDDDDLPVLQRAMAQLSPQHVAERIRSMIESNPALLGGEASAGVVKALGGAPIVDAEYVPVRVAKVEAAPRLTDGSR